MKYVENKQLIMIYGAFHMVRTGLVAYVEKSRPNQICGHRDYGELVLTCSDQMVFPQLFDDLRPKAVGHDSLSHRD